MLNTLFPPKREAPTKTLGPNAVVRVQTVVRRAIKTLRRDISDYAVDLRATYGKDQKKIDEGRMNKGAARLRRGRRSEMTTTITTIQRPEPKGGVSHRDRPAAWSAPYDEKGIGEEIEALPPSKRLDAALGWHARHGRML